MSRVAVIDYDAGNTLSVIKALEYLGTDVELTRDADVLKSCDKVIFPGVGAYFDAMQRLKAYGLEGTIREMIASGVPFLGICLGMQLLFDESEENIGAPGQDTVRGLGILPGRISRFKGIEPLKTPHMGWNSLDIKNTGSVLFKGIDNGAFVYFVHSYYLKAADRSDVLATSTYGHEFDCAVGRGNLYGCQFHPEKSGETGLQILRNFTGL